MLNVIMPPIELLTTGAVKQIKLSGHDIAGFFRYKHVLSVGSFLFDTM
jgi:hypothetical protein